MDRNEHWNHIRLHKNTSSFQSESRSGHRVIESSSFDFFSAVALASGGAPLLGCSHSFSPENRWSVDLQRKWLRWPRDSPNLPHLAHHSQGFADVSLSEWTCLLNKFSRVDKQLAIDPYVCVSCSQPRFHFTSKVSPWSCFYLRKPCTPVWRTPINTRRLPLRGIFCHLAGSRKPHKAGTSPLAFPPDDSGILISMFTWYHKSRNMSQTSKLVVNIIELHTPTMGCL